ncbi:hypothetical protein HOE425_330713 [Hoeflea sp. EC-HK425]|nr:hypothetical protein HOE425_330713 [Hoeflea sp. EC-HK425]
MFALLNGIQYEKYCFPKLQISLIKPQALICPRRSSVQLGALRGLPAEGVAQNHRVGARGRLSPPDSPHHSSDKRAEKGPNEPSLIGHILSDERRRRVRHSLPQQGVTESALPREAPVTKASDHT